MSLDVGEGILDQMTAQGDRPMRDSVYGKNQDGSNWEQGFGQKGAYFASNASGQWVSVGPLPVAPAA